MGGLFNGGGFGALLRKYGLAADNIIYSKIVDDRGRLLDRGNLWKKIYFEQFKGEAEPVLVSLFLGRSLVDVPPLVFVFHLTKNLEQGVLNLHKWQYVQHKLSEDLFLNLGIMAIPYGGNKTLMVSFTCLFLGKTEHLLKIIEENFPKRGLAKEHCLEKVGSIR